MTIFSGLKVRTLCLFGCIKHAEMNGPFSVPDSGFVPAVSAVSLYSSKAAFVFEDPVAAVLIMRGLS
jgi:hypothetical protein